MAVIVRTTWSNDNPATVWNTLARKLGRDPTSAEARDEVLRILRGNAVYIATAMVIIATLPFFGVVTFLTAVSL